MSRLPTTGLVRVRQLLGDPNAEIPIPAIIPVQRSTLWRWIKAGRFPPPVRTNTNAIAFRVEDVRGWIEEQAARIAA